MPTDTALAPHRLPLRATLLAGVGQAGPITTTMIFNAFVPLLLADLGLSAFLVGVAMSVDNYLLAAFDPLVGAASDRTRSRWGRRLPWLTVGCIAAAAAFAAIPLGPTLLTTLVAIVLYDLAAVLVRAPGTALLVDLVAERHRDAANGVVNLLVGAGIVVAFAGGGWLHERDAALPFLLGAAVLLVTAAVLATWLREPRRPGDAVPDGPRTGRPGRDGRDGRTGRSGRDGRPGRAVLRQVAADPALRLAMLVVLFWSIGSSAIESWASSYGTAALGLSVPVTTTAIGVGGVVFLVCVLPAGLLAGRVPRLRLLRAAAVPLAVLWLVAGPLVTGAAGLYLLLAVSGALGAVLTVVTFPWVVAIGESRLPTGVLVGVYTLVMQVAFAIGPQLAGLAIELSGSYRAVYAVAGTGVALAALLLSLPGRWLGPYCSV